MSEDKSKFLSTVNSANIVQSIKNFPNKNNIESKSAEKIQRSDETNAKVRRSTRDIKRPKFDDELFENLNLSKNNIRKRHYSPDNAEDNAKKRTQKNLNFNASTPLNIHTLQSVSPKKTTATTSTSNLNSNVNKDESILNTKIDIVEDSLTIDRKKKERLAYNKNQKAKQLQLLSEVNNMTTFDNMKRWTAEDDISLIAAVTHVCDLTTVFNCIKFSKKFSLVEIEERWYELLYDENASRLARKRMDHFSREKMRQIQSKIPFSVAEEEIIKSITVANASVPHTFEMILEQNRDVFHYARNPKVIEDYWRELKYYGLLADQKSAFYDDDLFAMEKNFVLCTLVEGEKELPLDVDERHATRNVVISEREAQEWDKVFVKVVTGIENTVLMAADTVAVIRGRNVTFDIRKEKALIGRSTHKHRVDVNLTLEGPSTRISRKQALMKLTDNGEYILLNLGKRAIYVDGKTILQGEKTRLNNNSIIEIALIRLHFFSNEQYKKKIPQKNIQHNVSNQQNLSNTLNPQQSNTQSQHQFLNLSSSNIQQQQQQQQQQQSTSFNHNKSQKTFSGTNYTGIDCGSLVTNALGNKNVIMAEKLEQPTNYFASINRN